MQQWQMLSRTIRYQKAAADNAFNILNIIQTSGEKLLKSTLEQYPWMPKGGQENYLIWSNTCLKTTAQMKAYVDKGYEEAERLLNRASEKQETATPKADKPQTAKTQEAKSRRQNSGRAKTAAKKKAAPAAKSAPVTTKEKAEPAAEKPPETATAPPQGLKTKETAPKKAEAGASEKAASSSPQGNNLSQNAPEKAQEKKDETKRST